MALPSQIQKNNNSQFSGFFLLLAWFLVIVIIAFIIRTKIGYTIAFFFTIASIIIILAIGSPTIVTIFNNAAYSNTQ